MSASVTFPTSGGSLKRLTTLALCLFLAACAGSRDYRATSPDGPGKPTTAIALAAVSGDWDASDLGDGMNKEDRLFAERTAQNALEFNKPGQTATWRNAQTGNSGTMTPAKNFENAAGKYCRTFKTSIFIDGDQEKGTGTACRQPDGTWQIES